MTDELKRSLGARIRSARKRAGLTQDELATRISKSPESVSNIERGAQLPMLDTLSDIARVLDAPLTELLAAPERGISAGRLRLESELAELGRTLDEDRLAIAVQQVAALAGAKKPR